MGITAALLAAVPAVADPSSVASKQAEAQRVAAQIHEIDSRLEKAIEAYDLANVRLDRIKHALRVNAHDLAIARGNLKHAQKALADRLVTLYVAGGSNSTLDVLLGATGLDDLLNRIDTVNRVSDQDARVVTEVVAFRTAVSRHRDELRRARAAQAALVGERAAQKTSIERQLAERQRYLNSVKSEVARLQAAERAQQARLARQVQVRLQLQRQQQEQRQLELAAEPVVGVTAVTPEGITVAPPSRYGGVVAIAMQYLGIPYVWGGDSPSTGFDCSGFVSYVYAQLGVSLPHNAATQFAYGTPVSKEELEPGDLVFFDGLSHNGIYIGGGQFIHSPHTGDVVKISSLSDPWYAATWVGAKRL